MRRIALTQRVVVLSERAERRDALDQAWTELLAHLGYLPILTGGNDLAHLRGARAAAPERDALERGLLTHCSQRNLPVLAACRGMQMLVCFHGGSVEAVDGHVGTPHPIVVPGSAPFGLLRFFLLPSWSSARSSSSDCASSSDGASSSVRAECADAAGGDVAGAGSRGR